jgi:hypothetical protein
MILSIVRTDTWSVAKAERIIGEEPQRLGWNEADLPQRNQSDPEKLALAARLRRETTLPVKWIAARVQLGTSRSANAKLHACRRQYKTGKDVGAKAD